MNAQPAHEAMSSRAQFCLAVCAFHNALYALICLHPPRSISEGPGFAVIRSVLPLAAWGVLLALVALAAIYAYFTRSRATARSVLVCSAAICAAWVVGLVCAWINAGITGATLIVALVSLIGYELAMARQPMRVPHEDIG